jgi:hypothetical protein
MVDQKIQSFAGGFITSVRNMSDLFADELTSGKPLFSIQVDDVLIQEIFRQLSDQLSEQRREIERLRAELDRRPTAAEFAELSGIVQLMQNQYSASSSKFSKSVERFYSSLEESTRGINELVESKTSEMLFAVNAAIRGQMELLEKSPQMTQDAIDSLHQLKLLNAKLSQKVSDISDAVSNIAASFGGSTRVDGLTTESACSFIREAVDRDRKSVADMRNQLGKFSAVFNDFKEQFEVILPFQRLGYPQWTTNVCYNRSKVPTFPTFPHEASIYAYFSYISGTMPYVQAVLREFHSYLLQLDATVSQKADRGEFEMVTAKTKRMVNGLVSDVEDYREKRNTFVLHQDFEELASDILALVSGASNAAATNTRCITCGKFVKATTGAIKAKQPKPDKESELRTADVLRLDGLQQEPPLSVRKVSTARLPKRPPISAPR